MAKRAKELAISDRRIYHPESAECSECGGAIKLQSYYQWDKRVQHMSRAVHISSRGGVCVNEACPQADQVVTSVIAQSQSLPGCTYGLDVIAQIGWWRDQEHQDRGEIHRRLEDRGVQLSERQVDYLYHQYQILLACVGHQDKSRLHAIVDTHGGLKICLDGLSPEGASEQLWVVREVESQTTLVVAWLEKVNHETLQVLLGPVEALGMPILATVSDKQPCLKKALEQLWPTIPHQWCQPHYLGNVAAPIYEHDRQLKTAMRQEVRTAIGQSLSAVLNEDEASAVHFVAGVALNYEPSRPPTTPSDDEPPDDEVPPSRAARTPSSGTTPRTDVHPAPALPAPSSADAANLATAPVKTVAQIVQEFALDLQECLTRQGRAPFVLAGLQMFDDLVALRDTFRACLAIHEHPVLRLWTDALTRILTQYTAHFADVVIAQQWLDGIKTILAPPSHPLMLANDKTDTTATTKGEFVQEQFTAWLNQLTALSGLSPFLTQLRTQLVTTTQNYWDGLFHGYDIPGLPTSNNALESLFGQTKRLIRRRLGIHHLRDALRRQAPWALLESDAESAAELAQLFQQVSHLDYLAQRTLFEQRLQQLLHRFRWRHRRDELLELRLHQWTEAHDLA